MRSLKLSVVNSLRVVILAPAIMGATFSTIAMADDEYTDTARVISVTPQIERVNVPRQECHTEYQQQSYSNGDRSITGAVIGGVAGGLLGNTIGRGNGRIASAAIGAGVGAIVGDRIANSRENVTSTRSVPVQSCHQVDNWQSINTGYLVTYEYNGRTYRTVTSKHPGHYIDVNVAVSPNSHMVSQVNYIETIQYGDSKWRGSHQDRGWHRGHRKHHDHDTDDNHRDEHRYY